MKRKSQSTREEKEFEEFLKIANFDLKTFKSLTGDFMDLYENGLLRMLFVGPVMSGEFLGIEERTLAKKHSLNKQELEDAISAIVLCIHHTLTGEDEEALQYLKKHNVRAAQSYQKKLDFIRSVLKEHEGIEQAYLTYSLSKTNYFSNLEWDAELKVFHSPSVVLKRPHSIFPVGRIKLSFFTPDFPPDTDALEFEITPKDIVIMIKSLQNLKDALENLKGKKLTEGG